MQNIATNDYNPKPGKKGSFFVVIFVVVCVLCVLLAFAIIPRLNIAKELKEQHAKTSGAVPIVNVVAANMAGFDEVGVLPGNIEAIQYANIYARVDGYLKSRLVDIGDKVHNGQLLAEIDTPTVDEELAQSQADLAQAQAQQRSAESNLKESIAKDLGAKAAVDKAQANENLAAVTAKRWENMATKGSVSLQSRDERVTSFAAQSATLADAKAQEQAAQAAVKTAEAQVSVAKATVLAKLSSVKRYEAEQSFKYVRAPFDGIITQRNVDPGALITSGSQTRTLELFQLAKIETLRIYVNAPQTVAHYIATGQLADVIVPEYPDRIFKGKITNAAGALDPNTRTRLTEVHINNADHALLPGMYAQVKITVVRSDPWVRVPGSSLVPRLNNMYVAVVENGKARFQKVAIGRDFGDEVEIRAGLKGTEKVITSPPVDLRDGEAVEAQQIKND